MGRHKSNINNNGISTSINNKSKDNNKNKVINNTDNLDNKDNLDNLINTLPDSKESNINVLMNETDTITTNSMEPVKKKRGRKPKLKTAEELELLKNKKPSRRGRKPKDKFKDNDMVSNINDIINDINENTNIIIKLPLSCEELNDKFNIEDKFNYMPNLPNPTPYDNLEYKFCNYTNIDNVNNDNVNENSTNNVNNDNVNNITQYIDTNRIQNNCVNNNNLSSDNHNSISSNILYNTDTQYSINTDTQYSINTDTQYSINTDTQYSMNISAPTNIIVNDYDKQSKTLDYNNISKLNKRVPYKDPTFINNIIKDDTNESTTMKQIDILIHKKYKQVKYLKLAHEDTLSNYELYNESTTKLCYWCCHSFDNKPWGIPLKYDNDNNYFICTGNFCSPNCTLSYINQKYNNNTNKWEYISLLNFLYFKCFSKSEIIQPAPNKICLDIFGGPLTINEFRLLTLNNKYVFNINYPICYNIIPYLEQRNNNIKQEDYFISQNEDKLKTTKSKYKIKRNKPIYANKNTLEKILSFN